jgi:hypothetical protein
MEEIETARKEGRGEGIKDVARSMKANGLSPDIIAACTSLSPAEIASL